MKNKFLIVALIGILMSAGIVLLSCDAGCPGDGDCTLQDNKYCGFSVKSSWSKEQADKAVDCGLEAIKYVSNPGGYSCICK
ncbi:MAG: hypothetical protein FWC19_09260 [Treponema sp.]|nr:hypothetical protein [Treponema sp.]MCL2272971.1 hypothetical protein [Treponema sp.]